MGALDSHLSFHLNSRPFFSPLILINLSSFHFLMTDLKSSNFFYNLSMDPCIIDFPKFFEQAVIVFIVKVKVLQKHFHDWPKT